MRHYTLLDKFITGFDTSLKTLMHELPHYRDNPANPIEDLELTKDECEKSIGRMRVNHTGEVCAQALYYGQMMVARTPAAEEMLQQAANEETDHLNWCRERIQELGGRTSFLNLFWYWHSFSLGAFASICGDKWSLGFVEETERQVSEHLAGHLKTLPEKDLRSRAIVTQMHIDELEHGQSAKDAGAAELPKPVVAAMKFMSKVMTTLAYRV